MNKEEKLIRHVLTTKHLFRNIVRCGRERNVVIVVRSTKYESLIKQYSECTSMLWMIENGYTELLLYKIRRGDRIDVTSFLLEFVIEKIFGTTWVKSSVPKKDQFIVFKAIYHYLGALWFRSEGVILRLIGGGNVDAMDLVVTNDHLAGALLDQHGEVFKTGFKMEMERYLLKRTDPSKLIDNVSYFLNWIHEPEMENKEYLAFGMHLVWSIQSTVEYRMMAVTLALTPLMLVCTVEMAKDISHFVTVGQLSRVLGDYLFMGCNLDYFIAASESRMQVIEYMWNHCDARGCGQTYKHERISIESMRTFVRAKYPSIYHQGLIDLIIIIQLFSIQRDPIADPVNPTDKVKQQFAKLNNFDIFLLIGELTLDADEFVQSTINIYGNDFLILTMAKYYKPDANGLVGNYVPSIEFAKLFGELGHVKDHTPIALAIQRNNLTLVRYFVEECKLVPLHNDVFAGGVYIDQSIEPHQRSCHTCNHPNPTYILSAIDMIEYIDQKGWLTDPCIHIICFMADSATREKWITKLQDEGDIEQLLCFSSQFGRLQVIEQVLRIHQTRINPSSSCLDTLIMWDRIELLDTVIKLVPSLQFTSKGWMTVGHLGRLDLIPLLESKSSSNLVKSEYWATMVNGAVANNQIEFIKQMIKQYDRKKKVDAPPVDYLYALGDTYSKEVIDFMFSTFKEPNKQRRQPSIDWLKQSGDPKIFRATVRSHHLPLIKHIVATYKLDISALVTAPCITDVTQSRFLPMIHYFYQIAPSKFDESQIEFYNLMESTPLN